MYNLFLDDFRQPPMVANYLLPVEDREQFLKDEWVIVKNYDEFVEVVERLGMPSKIAFDHDLADEHYAPPGVWNDPELYNAWEQEMTFKEKNGFDCAKYIIEKLMDSGEPIPTIIVHSQNPVGAENIKKLFESFAKHR